MAESIRKLRDMGFGSHGNNFLQKALDAHGGDLEETLEALLSGWTGKAEGENRKSSKASKKKGGQSNAQPKSSKPRPAAASQPADNSAVEPVSWPKHSCELA